MFALLQSLTVTSQPVALVDFNIRKIGKVIARVNEVNSLHPIEFHYTADARTSMSQTDREWYVIRIYFTWLLAALDAGAKDGQDRDRETKQKNRRIFAWLRTECIFTSTETSSFDWVFNMRAVLKSSKFISSCDPFDEWQNTLICQPKQGKKYSE